MKRHIVFDFDDTISSAYEHNQQLFVDTFLCYKAEVDEDFVRKVHYGSRGRSMVEQFTEVVQKFELNVDPLRLVEENELLHQKQADQIKIFPGVIEILKHFKSLGKVVSVCSNRSAGSLRKILELNGLNKYVDNVVSCKDEGHEKPDPYCLLQLLAKYPHISPSEVIYFGDSRTDAEFASNSGVDYLIIDHYLNQKNFYLMALNSFAGSEDELLVEVDKDNQEIGAIFRMDAHHNPKRYHRAVSVLVFNSRGQIVLQKRSPFKLVDSGKWDLAGGHQVYGQTIEQTAEIELMEELGIKADLKLIRTGLRQDNTQSEYYNLYYALHDGPYKADPHEVSEVKCFDCQKLIAGKYSKKYEFLFYIKDRLQESAQVWQSLVKN